MIERRLSDIRITKGFENHPPSAKKLEECRKYFLKNGYINKLLRVNQDGYLVDGYVGYLILKEFGVESAIVLEMEKDIA